MAEEQSDPAANSPGEILRRAEWLALHGIEKVRRIRTRLRWRIALMMTLQLGSSGLVFFIPLAALGLSLRTAGNIAIAWLLFQLVLIRFLGGEPFWIIRGNAETERELTEIAIQAHRLRTTQAFSTTEPEAAAVWDAATSSYLQIQGRDPAAAS